MTQRRGGRDLSTGTRSQSTLREQEWNYYDTQTMLNTVLQNRMFTQGLAGNSKLLWQTNLKNNGMITTGERMTVMRIALKYITHADIASAVLTNIYTMLTQTTLEFKIAGSDSILTLPLSEIIGIPLMATLSPNATVLTYHPLLSPRYHGIYPLNRPITLAENESFEVVITHHVAPNAALNGDWLRMSLCGILERKVS